MHVLSLPLLTFSQHQNIGQKFKLPSNDKFSKTHFFFEKNPCHYSKQHQTHPNQGKNTRAARKLHSLITRSFRDSCERFKEGWTAPRSSDEPKETKEKTGIDKRLVQAWYTNTCNCEAVFVYFRFDYPQRWIEAGRGGLERQRKVASPG